ncbi:hypothetical protein L9F63_010730, partial [Diploptera punctata]
SPEWFSGEFISKSRLQQADEEDFIRKSIHAMSDLEDFDHVFGIRGEEEFDRVYQRIQLEEQENRPDENNGSGFIAENSGSPVTG